METEVLNRVKVVKVIEVKEVNGKDQEMIGLEDRERRSVTLTMLKKLGSNERPMVGSDL